MEKSTIIKSPYLTDRDRLNREELKWRFTNRQPLIDKFEKKLKQPPPIPVLVFFGLGGCGKSYLLHYLHYEYGYRWQDAPGGYPHAYISFRPGYTPPTATDALWSLRSQLRAHWPEFSFPRFDLLWGTLWERMYKIHIRDNATLLPEEIEWLTDLLESTEQLPFIGIPAKAINLIARLGGKAKRWLKQRNVLDWFVEHLEKPFKTGWKIALQSMEIGELQMLLPKAFAADLADSTVQLKLPHNRAILFVDTYEYLQEQLGESRGKETPSFMQVLAEELLRFKTNVVLVLGGKDKVRWAEVHQRNGTWALDTSTKWASGVSRNDTFSFVSTFLEQYLVNDLSERDSMEYLQQRRNVSDAIAKEIYELTRGYALGLSTAADLLEEAGEQISTELAVLRARISKFEPLSRAWCNELSGWLLERLLEQLMQHGRNELVGLLRAAAIPRWFNEDILFHLIGGYNLQDQFNQLLRYSFVEPQEITVGILGIRAYRLHPTIRSLLRQDIRIEAQRREWNRSAMTYFDNLMNNLSDSDRRFAYEIEALYHKSVLNPTEGLHAFMETFECEVSRYRLARCEMILQALGDLDSWSDVEEAQILTLSGRLYMVSAQYQFALEKFGKAQNLQPLNLGFAPHRIAIAQNLAECYRLKGEYFEALGLWEEIGEIGERHGELLIRFQAAWGKSLTYKLLDNVPRALELCDEVETLLKRIGSGVVLANALGFGIHEITSKPAHVKRHKAELLRYMGDYAGSAKCCEQYLSLYKKQHDSPGHYYGLLILAHLSRMEGNFENAQKLAEQARDCFDKLMEHRGYLSAIRALGQIAFAREQDAEAVEHFQRLIDSPPGVYPYGPIYGHLGMGELARLSTNFDVASQHYEVAARLCHGLGGKVEIAYAKLGLAEICGRGSGYSDVLSLVAEINETGISSGHPWIQVYANLVGAIVAPKDQKHAFFDKADRASEQFRRRQNDKNLEGQVIMKVQELLISGKEVPPFRFNFL